MLNQATGSLVDQRPQAVLCTCFEHEVHVCLYVKGNHVVKGETCIEAVLFSRICRLWSEFYLKLFSRFQISTAFG